MPVIDSLTCTFVVSCAQPKHGELQLGHGKVVTKSMSGQCPLSGIQMGEKTRKRMADSHSVMLAT